MGVPRDRVGEGEEEATARKRRLLVRFSGSLWKRENRYLQAPTPNDCQKPFKT